MPRPSDPPPAPGELGPPQRQRIAQMETQLDQARSALARQKNELDELRGRVEEKEKRLEALIASLEKAPTMDPQIEARLAEVEGKRAELARELHERVDRAARGTDLAETRVARLEGRLAELEEGTEAVRIRMRLERVGHQLQHLEVRAEGMEERIEELRRAEERTEDNTKKLTRLESLFDELAEEVRAEPDAGDLGALRERLDDVEALVMKSGEQLDARRAEVDAQLAALGPIAARLSQEAKDADALSLLAARVEGLEGDLRGLRELPTRLARLEAAEAARAEETRALAGRLAEVEAARAREADALATRLAHLELLRAEEGESNATRLAELEAARAHEARALATRLADLEAAQAGARSEALAGLAARIEGVEELVLTVSERLDASRTSLEAQVAEVGKQVVEVGKEAEKRAASLPPPAPLPATDDLTRIKGIGPKFARLLADAGVGSFAQIAAWDEAEVERVAKVLGIAPSRIESAGWVESARRLLA